MSLSDSVLDGSTLGRLDRWRKARALFVRPDRGDAERALAQALGKTWARGQIYGRARRLPVERSAAELLARMEEALGPLADNVRVAPEDPAQTKWDAVGNLAPLPAARRQVESLWLVDILAAGRLFVEFQPIFDLATGETLGFEGLLRGRSDDGTVRLASELFPAAKRLGIDLRFEKLSWTLVLEAARTIPEGAILFLNVNPRLLIGAEPGLSALGAEAERLQFPYTRLALDLVEIERVDALEKLAAALAVPHDLGVSIALDDITSGYGTIKYCSGLSPRWIKVDSEITRGIGTDPRRRAVLRLLFEVARDASVGLVAEGIEAASDLDVCAAEGVVAAQGYFLARPAEGFVAATPEFRRWFTGRQAVTAPESAGAERDATGGGFEL